MLKLNSSDLPLNLSEVQWEQKSWEQHNFPNKIWQHAFMGMVEELGELSHALLKQEQGIRGDKNELELLAKDAIGDLLIFTTS